MIKKFSSPKIQYKLVAERSEANPSSLQFPTWCRGRDSNPHSRRNSILSRARLPISPPRHITHYVQDIIPILLYCNSCREPCAPTHNIMWDHLGIYNLRPIL